MKNLFIGRRIVSISIVLVIFSQLIYAQPEYVPSKDIMLSRKEFQDNKFGVFIHWGVYSMLGQGEWVMNVQNLNYLEYSKLPSGFYPIKFDAAKWVSDIKAAGAKYICITSRHHDGFSMFETKMSDYNIVNATPFGRDVLRELAQECHKQGIKLHFYYSTLDWYRDDYMPRGRTGLGTGRPGKGEWKDYFEFMCGQLTELLTNYGEIRCIWFDGHWDHDQDPDFDWGYDKLYSLIHKLQPSCLIGNNHHINPILGEDIQIFERDVPGENTAGWHQGGISDLPLETCQTMNGSWGYRISDQEYKSSTELIKYLVSTAGRNANLLLNVGPQPNGEIPAAAVERLKLMGSWLDTFGESIYGTRNELLAPQPWGVVTHKEGEIFLHIFPDDLNKMAETNPEAASELFIPIEGLKIKSITPFGVDHMKIKYKKVSDGIRITLPEIPKDDCPDYILRIKLS